ncbi:hypothetical protein [Microbacterium rhizophilus]|uniref:hypothetical protein n=1 Tax=Microbacterium rhizophilus TaxID=3138934 RepID=UPI0031F0AFF9
MTDVVAPPRSRDRLRGWSASVILVLGVFFVPMAIAFALNSWDAPDAEAYVRMAFATVAGQTIAIATVLGLLVSRIIARADVATISTFAIIALVVTGLALSSIGSAGTQLLQRLDSLG